MGVEIPVLMADGKKVAKYRIGEAELRRVLTMRGRLRAGGAGQAGPFLPFPPLLPYFLP